MGTSHCVVCGGTLRTRATSPGERGLSSSALLVQLDSDVLRRELAAERAQHEVPRARVAILERRARDETLDHREDVAPRRRRPRDAIAEDVAHGGAEKLPTFAGQRSSIPLALAESLLDEEVGEHDARC